MLSHRLILPITSAPSRSQTHPNLPQGEPILTFPKGRNELLRILSSAPSRSQTHPNLPQGKELVTLPMNFSPLSFSPEGEMKVTLSYSSQADEQTSGRMDDRTSGRADKSSYLIANHLISLFTRGVFVESPGAWRWGAAGICIFLSLRKRSLKCCIVLRHVNPTPNSCVVPSSQS